MSGENAPSALHRLKGWEKLRYILDYYKLPIILVGILLYIVVWFTIKTVTKKDVVLYLGLVNVAQRRNLPCSCQMNILRKRFTRNPIMSYIFTETFLCQRTNQVNTTPIPMQQK